MKYWHFFHQPLRALKYLSITLDLFCIWNIKLNPAFKCGVKMGQRNKTVKHHLTTKYFIEFYLKCIKELVISK